MKRIALLIVAALLSACGGGGGGGGTATTLPAPQPSTTSVQINLGDDPADRLIAVGVTINSLSLNNSTGGITNGSIVQVRGLLFLDEGVFRLVAGRIR